VHYTITKLGKLFNTFEKPNVLMLVKKGPVLLNADGASSFSLMALRATREQWVPSSASTGAKLSEHGIGNGGFGRQILVPCRHSCRPAAHFLFSAISAVNTHRLFDMSSA
jgi:hypothetical protein